MLRRLTIVALVCLGLLGLVAGGSYLYRVALAQAVAEQMLADLGLVEVRLTVEQIGLRHGRLSAVAAGQRGELAIDELTVRYRIPLVFSGQVDELRVKGLVLKLDLTGERPMMGSLQAPLDAVLEPDEDDEGPAASPDARPDAAPDSAAVAPPPRVLFESGRIEALTSLGPLFVDFDGEVAPEADGSAELDLALALSATQGLLSGRLRAALTAERNATGSLEIDGGAIALGDQALRAALRQGTLAFAWRDPGLKRLEGKLGFDALSIADADLGPASLTFDMEDGELAASAGLGADDLAYRLKVESRISDYPLEPWIDLRVSGQAGAEASVWSLLPPPRPAAGRVAFDLSTRGTVSAEPPPGYDPADLFSWLADGGLSAQASLALESVKLPDMAESLDLTLPLAAELSERVLQVSLTGPAEAALAGPSPALLAAAGLSADQVGEELQVSIIDDSDSPFAARLTERGSGLHLEVSGGASASAPGRGEFSAVGGADIALDRLFGLARAQLVDVILTATSPALPGTPITDFRLKGKLTGDLARVPGKAGGVSEEPPGSGQPNGHEIEHQLLFVASDLRLKVNRRGEPPIGVKSRVARVRFEGAAAPDGIYNGVMAVDGGRLALPELALAVDGLSVEAPLGAAAEQDSTVRFTMATVADSTEPPRFHPVRITGKLTPGEDSLDLAATVLGRDRTGRINITARQLPGGERGTLRAKLVPLAFEPGGAQPASLSPLLEGLTKVTGQVEASAELAWNGDGITGKAQVGLDSLAFELDGIKVAGLDGTLELDQLMPPSSPPGQVLTARSIDPGLPLTDLTIRFRLLPGDSPRALLEQAEFSAAGGRYRLGETVIDPQQTEQKVELQVVDLELATLFESIDVEGLSGTGSLNGVVPVTIEPAGIAISKARLRAKAPGVLRYESEAASQALAGGGEPVELMLEALEDFHYDRLILAANKAVDGETRLRLRLQGSNPEVLDGHPFKININLTGNLDPILKAIAQGRNISSNLLERTWRLRP